MSALAAVLPAIDLPAVRWLVFRRAEKSTSGRWLPLAREHLTAFYPSALFGAGTNHSFAEVNRKRPPRTADFVAYSVNPQVHAEDDAALVEALEGQGWTVSTAREFTGGLPVAVTPVTLRPRFNPDAPETAPSSVDPRQTTLSARHGRLEPSSTSVRRGPGA